MQKERTGRTRGWGCENLILVVTRVLSVRKNNSIFNYLSGKARSGMAQKLGSGFSSEEFDAVRPTCKEPAVMMDVRMRYSESNSRHSLAAPPPSGGGGGEEEDASIQE